MFKTAPVCHVVLSTKYYTYLIFAAGLSGGSLLD